MKKKLALLLSCMVLCALVLVGCGGGGNAYAGTTWELTRAEAYGVTMEGEMLDNTVGEMTIKFVDNSKMEINGMGMSIEGTYTVEGNTVTIEYFDQPIAFQRNGNQLSAEYDGEAMVLEKE